MPFVAKYLPVLGSIDRTVHDFYRYALAPAKANDPDITLLLYDDAVARETGKTSPTDRALLAAALAGVETAGASAVGIDMIFVQPTEDENILIDQLRQMKIPVFIAFANPEADQAAYWDQSIAAEAVNYQNDFWRRIDNPLVQRVSPAIGIDASGIARRWPQLKNEKTVPLAAALGNARQPAKGYSGAIAFSRLSDEEADRGLQVATDMFPVLPLDTLADPELTSYFQHLVKDRIILIGSDIFNSDQIATPITRFSNQKAVAGVTVHAHMLRQALDRNFMPSPPLWSILLLAIGMAAAGATTATIERRPLLLAVVAAIQFAALAMLPVALHQFGYDFLTISLLGLLLSWLIVFFNVSYMLRSRTSNERAFARSALGKFLPEKVALEILESPEKLKLEGDERPIFMLFTDLEGFTRFSHGRPAEDTARILNRYLEEMSQVILDHSGTIDKFVGDAIVAFWGAPLVEPEDADNSVACAIALYHLSERLRVELADGDDMLGRTRIGLHFGEVTVGNFGGERRIQYTALGDAMNIAARLEGANKYLRTNILVSEDVVERAPGHDYRSMGAIRLSGVANAIKVYEPIDDERKAYTLELNNAIMAIEAADTQAEQGLRALSAQYPEDTAMVALVERIDRLSREKPYVLDGK